MTKSKLLEEWEAARDDLKIDIVAPFELDIGNGRLVKADVLVKHFGGRNGALIFKESDTFWRYHDDLSKLDYGSSVLDEPSEPYDREALVDMLSDWGWTGSDNDKPAWVKPPPEDEMGRLCGEGCRP